MIYHICSDFAKQAIYLRLVENLAALGERQFVFSAVRSSAEANWTPGRSVENTTFEIKHILRPYHRVFFRTKIRALFQELQGKLAAHTPKIVHAHFLYSDGALALMIKRHYGVPFIVAVRNTDLNYFMRFRPDLWSTAVTILLEAGAVVFLSPAYKEQFLARVGERVRVRIQWKCIVVPNGLSDSWLDAGVGALPIKSDSEQVRLLYVGDFSKNKNVTSVLLAYRKLSYLMPVSLTLVGGGGDGERKILKICNRAEYRTVRLLGRVNDECKLRAIYRTHDVFVMPSFKETFGVAYIEALSQGLSIIYSKGQGVDGFFNSCGVAEAVDPGSIDSISQAIVTLAKRRKSSGPLDSFAAAKQFCWEGIARQYQRLYKNLEQSHGANIRRSQ